MQKKPQAQQLQAKFQGRVVGPRDQDYDQLRTVFYGGVDHKPAAIVLVETVADIQKAVTLARENKWELAVRSGGHSIVGHSVSDGGLVIDLRKMKKMDLDFESQTVWAETGLTAGEITQTLDPHHLVIGFGDTGSVGIGGITLNGGVGFLVRKFGLTIDNLLAAEIVTADGQLLQVDKDHHPDLFWAIRGGGGNFGVVTRFKFQLHKLPQVLGGMLFLPAKAETITRFMNEAAKAPPELSGIINIMPSPPLPFVPAEHHGKLIMMAIMMYAGDPAEGEKVLAPFRALTPPIGDTIKPMTYAEIFFPDDGSYHPTAASQTMFMKEVTIELAQKMIDRLSASDATMRVVQLRALGGAFAEVPVDATAFAHRQSKIMTNVAAFYEDDDDKKDKEQWVDEFAAELNQGDDGAYVGFIGVSDGSMTKQAYPGETLQRLQVVKKKYDPNNLFRLNQNIEPA